MPENQELIQRVKTILANKEITEGDLYGGLAFSINGKPFCGVCEDMFFLLVGEERFEEILTHPLARPLVVDGTAVPGWVEIVPTGIKRDIDLTGWINTGLSTLE